VYKIDDAKRILVICSESEVPMVEEGAATLEEYHVEVETAEKIFAIGIQKYLAEIIDLLQKNPSRYHGVVGTRDMTSVFANVICEKTGKPSASVNSLINCQNKFLSRCLQKTVVPEHVPGFWLDTQFLRQFPLASPYFVKPVRGNVSYLSQKAYSYEELRNIIVENTAEMAQYNQYFLESLSVASHLDNVENLETCNRFICEEIVTGQQLTVSGYVYGGSVRLYGSAGAVFMEDGISFSHHEFPCELPASLEEKVEEVITGLVKALGLDNTFFNVEIRVEPGEEKMHIIEVNCRQAFQFVKTVEKVKGINLIRWLCDLSVGKEPSDKAVEEGAIRYPYCYNFELRESGDREILRVPTKTDLEELERYYPEVTVKNLVEANTRLSDYKQNPSSFRYCILDVPGNSRKEIIEKMEKIRPILGYEFKEQ